MSARRQRQGCLGSPVNVIEVRDMAVGMVQAAERGCVGECDMRGNTTPQALSSLIA